jgi:short subunit dehydrogenase-like uncharacterized protein
VPIAPGSLERTFDFGSGPTPAVAVSWGDLATAFSTTGILDIETYFAATPAVRAMVAAERFLGPALAMPPTCTLLGVLSGQLPDGPHAAERASHSAVIVAEAEHPCGRVVRARLRTPEAYSLTAHTAVAIVGEVVKGNYEPGFQTPARLFGADYILRFDGVSRETL